MAEQNLGPRDFFAKEDAIADLGLIACPGAEELCKLVDSHLVRWAREVGNTDVDTFIIPSDCPRFQSGDAKGLVLRTLEVAQIREDEYFGSLIADDLKGILRDIREQHRPDTMTADEVSLAATVQGQLQDAMNFEGSSEEKQVRSFLATFGIDYDKLTKEQFVSLIEILKLSKYLKSPINQRGKARPQLSHGKGKKKRK